MRRYIDLIVIHMHTLCTRMLCLLSGYVVARLLACNLVYTHPIYRFDMRPLTQAMQRRPGTENTLDQHTFAYMYHVHVVLTCMYM